MKFWWWDDAFAQAFELAQGTEIKHNVSRGADGHWTVEPVIVVMEPCS